jgi:hypothetical protein
MLPVLRRPAREGARLARLRACAECRALDDDDETALTQPRFHDLSFSPPEPAQNGLPDRPD